MRKYGKTGSGMQRWQCQQCDATGIRKRDDQQKKVWQHYFKNWLMAATPLTTIARRLRCSLSTLRRAFRECWKTIPMVPALVTPARIIVLDGTSLIARQMVVLVARDIRGCPQIAWSFVIRETTSAWSDLLSHIPAPQFVVCDGQKGLLYALQMHWPTTIIQRCIIHVVRQSLAWITKKPQTLAGQQLRVIVGQLLAVRTRRQRRKWMRRFRKWCVRWEAFLNTRTRHLFYPTHWWYTHKKLRRARTLIVHALPHLFTFVRHPEVPRTSNHVEGGINARLHELFRAHRGISVIQKQILTAYFLLTKISKKSTRNDY